jgi:hypothetical protein
MILCKLVEWGEANVEPFRRGLVPLVHSLVPRLR